MTQFIRGKWALVTGASSGLGANLILVPGWINWLSALGVLAQKLMV